MSRRVVGNQIAEKSGEQELIELVPLYYENKSTADKFKKVADKYNLTIKEVMRNNDIPEFIAGDLKASVSVTPKEDFNELQAIEILRKSVSPEIFNQVVKTKEYLDFDSLEALAYNNQVDVSILAPCTTPKEPTITLRVTKVKS